MKTMQHIPFFTNSFNVLCIWHTNKNIAKNCKFGIEQEEWDKIRNELNLVWKSPTKMMFDTNWFKSSHQLPPSAIISTTPKRRGFPARLTLHIALSINTRM